MKKIMIVAALLGMCLSAMGAAPASGVYTNSFGGVLSVWDISGTYTEDVLGGNLSGSYTLAMDSQGKITGAGSASYWDGGLSIDLDFDIAGAVKQAASVTQVSFTQNITGSVEYDSEVFTVKGAFKYGLSIDQTARTLSGSISGKLCVSGQGCASIEQLNDGQPLTFEAAIPDGSMDGTWDLITTVQNVDGKTLVLQANVQLSNGRTIGLLGKGKYSATTDLSKISLKGDSLAAKGASLNILANGAGLNVVAVKAKLLGQKPVSVAP